MTILGGTITNTIERCLRPASPKPGTGASATYRKLTAAKRQSWIEGGH